MRLDRVREAVTEVVVQFGGEDLKVGYFAAAMTPALADDLSAEVAKGETGASSARMMGLMLSPVLAWWDLFATEQDEQEGHRMDTTPETIATLPIDLLRAVQVAIQGDQQPPGSKG